MSCCGQGMSNLMSQFKTTTTTITNKPHPHSTLQTQTSTFATKSHPHNTFQTTTQTTPQLFSSSFTKGGFMKFSKS
jgi:hypothetical protein